MPLPKAPRSKKPVPWARNVAPTNSKSQYPPKGDDLLEAIPEKGTPPEERLKDAASLHAIYGSLKNADNESCRNRAMTEAMFGGEPPYDDAELAASGRAEQTNLDFGEGGAALEAALTGYYDLTNSVDVMAHVVVDYGDDANERAEWENVTSEEYHRLLKDWPEFEFLFQRVCAEFVKHGVGVAFHPSETGWQFDVSGLNGFLIPRTTKASENQIDIAIAEREFQLHELYKFVKDEKKARGGGWNVEEVRKALATATSKEGSKNWRRDWEKLERDLKNNDYGISHSSRVVVRVIHAWIREYDGTVSHYLNLADGTNASFLFKKRSRFSAMSDCFTVFTYGIGNGYYASIRGLGFKLFPIVQVSNRLRGHEVDGAMFGSSVMVQPQDETALQTLELTYVGPYAVLPPKFNVIDRVMPNVATQVLPVINDLSLLLQNNVGTYRARQVTPEGNEETATGVKARVERESVLSTAAMNLFYLPWGRLLTTMIRRIASGRTLPTEPGYKEAKDFIARCIKRGVPEEALRKMVRAEPIRAIGYGSPAMRSVAFTEMLQMGGALDEVGLRRLLRDKFASKLGGYHNVDAYLPKATVVARQPVDADIANLENAAMFGGSEVPVRDGQIHATHLTIHLPEIVQGSDALDTILQEPEPQPGDVEILHKTLMFLSLAVPHAAHHVEAMKNDPVHEETLGEMKKALQETFAKMQAAAANLQKMAEAQTQEGQPAMEIDPKVQRMIDEWRTRKEIMIEEHQLKSNLKVADFRQKAVLRDAQTAQKLEAKRQEQNAA